MCQSKGGKRLNYNAENDTPDCPGYQTHGPVLPLALIKIRSRNADRITPMSTNPHSGATPWGITCLGLSPLGTTSALRPDLNLLGLGLGFRV